MGDATGQLAQLLLEQGPVLNGELAFFHLVFELLVDPRQFGRAFFNVRFQLVVDLLQFNAGLLPVEGEFDEAIELAILEGLEHIGEGFGRLGSL